MKRSFAHILFLGLLLIANCQLLSAAADTIRYVSPSGSYSNDGKSWATAKDKLQDAINDLRDYMAANHYTSGSVYVAAGTYVPTESTESSGGSMLNTSFKIYSGIHVYGGFDPVNPESKPGDRIMSNGKKCSENWADPSGIGTTSGTEIASQWDLRHKTVLTGNHTSTPVTFTFDAVRGRYNTTYPASSFHVVWFATNGEFETTNDSTAGHYRPLEHPASVNGCVISSGNASSRNTTFREHTGYGGGVYMVGNSELRNCIVERCNANLGGGGIYLDGGGVVEFCYVHTCQSPGVGVVEGYGGGVAVTYDGQVGHSHITSCAARCGGGLSISHVPGEYPVEERLAAHIMACDTAQVSFYSPFSTACVINNNTAAAEGGGIYLAEGGTINHGTVTANNCIGPDVTYYGRRHGRTGGIYIRNCGMIFNSVFWGNRCDANNDIQFAAIKQKPDADHEVFVFHSAFMNHDISDWTDVTKEMVFSLDKSNYPIKGTTGNYPCFFKPTVNPLDWKDIAPADTLWGAGVMATSRPAVDIPGPRIWHLTSYSALDQKGVQVTDAVQDVSEWVRHAHTDYGVVSNPYEPVSTLGALVRKPDPMSYSLVAPQGTEGRIGGDPIPTLFIDPNRGGIFDENDEFMPTDKEGSSWDTPIKDLGEAVQFFRQYLVDDDGGNHHYMIPALDEHGKATGEPTRYDYVQILVKEGKITTVGPGNYLDRNIRTASIRVESHMRLYGGYPTKLTGTSTAERNPRDYVTNITANITGIGGERGYANNSAHVIAMVNVEHSIVDGFTLSDANTHNVILSNSAMAGGGLIVNNGTTPQEKRIHMIGNQLRNCVITNCTSPKGAAVYVNGEYPDSEGMICYAELKMVNCVVRNNLADYEDNEHNIDDHGIVTANGRAYIEMEHCDIVNNVGYPFKADNRQTASDEPITCTHPQHGFHGFHGFMRVNNSIVFCNGDRPLDNRGQLGTMAYVMSVFPEGQDYVFGEYNMFDADLRLQLLDPKQPRGFFDPAFTEIAIPDDFVPEIPGNTTFGASLSVNLPSDKHNQAIFTRTDPSANTYPTFVNPSRNVGNSVSGDKPLYGGTVSYAPMTTNPCVNAAFINGYNPTNNYDRTDNCTRDRGGSPDIGAIENMDLPAAGTILYVTPDGAGKRDGSSWDNAIAGNTVYRLYGAGPAAGDSIDVQNNARLVNASTGEPVLTTDDRYQGGFARSWFTSSTTGKITETTVTDAWVTEDTVFVGGPRNSERSRGRENEFEETSNTNVISAGTTEPGFVAGWNDDTRYPYGEISGASRSFWRANPYHSKTAWATSGYDVMQTFVDSCIAKGWINNTHRENYVSGLQWAVEEAARRNHAATRLEGEVFDTIVQVWVGAGKYTDYKGYIMRDSVTVLGGFPAGKYAAPGMNERQALMSDVINIPKSLPAQDFEASDYETLLQISEVNPIASDTTLNPAAIKFQDNDLSRASTTDTRSYAYKTKHITNTYTYTQNETNTTNTYIYYPCFESGSSMHSYGSIPDSTQYIYGNQSDAAALSKDVWHIVYPNTKTYYNVDISLPQSTTLSIYDYDSPTTKIENKSSRYYRIGNGSLTGLRMFQTMQNVEDGTHHLTFDFMGGYRNGDPFDITTPCGIYLHILDASGNDLITPVLFKCRGNTISDTNKNNIRKCAYRKTVEFITTTTQNITIYVEVLDGVRNTTSADATYGTADGRDPEYIPWYYVWDKGTEANPDQNWGTKNPNRREFFITNFKLMTLDKNNSYVFTNATEVINDTIVDNPKATEVLSFDDYTVENSRTPLRKRVLTMPDVCVPTYGGGGIANPVNMDQSFSDNLPHTDRVWGPTKDKRTATTQTKQEDPHYVEYAEANWDGFTIRHGFLHDESMAHGGGAGVNMYEGGHLRNCIVINNIFASRNVKGAGIFCDGATSTIEGCFVLNNASVRGTELFQKQIFAGGMFMYEGTCFNSLFANNYSYGSAGGVGFCVGRFFNNTIAYNTATLVEGGKINGGAVSLATASKPNLFVANTVVYGNNGRAFREREESAYQGEGLINPFLHCYIQTEVSLVQNTYLKNIVNHEENSSSYGIGNTLLNGVAPSGANSPFAADYVNGVYTPGNARATNDYRLVNIHDTTCVNKGTEDFTGMIFEALKYKNPGKTDAYIKNLPIYKSVEEAKLPTNDVAFAKRVQDCQIDIGAYEYNAAFSIQPDTTTHPGHAIFYIAFNSPGGDASAKSPRDAACLSKIQLIFDAAGRYKYNLMTQSRYKSPTPTPVAGSPDSTWTVEVRLVGDSVNCTTSSDYAEWYTPTRSTKHGIPGYNDNPLDYSFIIPHGIHVLGGYSSDFYHYEDNDGHVVAEGTAGAHIVDERDPLTFRTVLSGLITSNTGAQGNCFHVVTFTNDLFDEYELKKGDGNQLAAFSALSDAENHRTVLDGLFIEDGYANAPDDEDKNGGAAIVTGYAHIRNCIVQNNEAQKYGGGLYLKPMALVSGTIIKNNSAEMGGGVYFEKPASEALDSLAHIYTTTICENKATATAGGMWFDNTFARVNSTALWHNSANDYANVSGNFSRTGAATEYPFNYCAVESRRLEGIGNVELSPTMTEGVRWDTYDPFNDLVYYPIVMSSTLARAGMTYVEWRNAMTRYTTLDSVDIAGVSRTLWTIPDVKRGYSWTVDSVLIVKNNDFIEIGARAINRSYEISIDDRHVMRRIYVVKPEDLNATASYDLQNNPGIDDNSAMYRQMGSCLYNPMQRLTDALDYIIRVRRQNPELYRNARFEIYLGPGTYRPYHNAYGEAKGVRANTFLIPEATTLVGGLSAKTGALNYGQEGYEDKYTNTIINSNFGNNIQVAGYVINFASATDIRTCDENHRRMKDYNQNSVIEPWEFESESILSGEVLSGENQTNVYHVITVHADSSKIGPQPLKYRVDSSAMVDWRQGRKLLHFPISQDSIHQFVEECEASKSARSVIIDGVNIKGGFANNVDTTDLATHPYETKTYFRGGGIFIDGNWTQAFDTLDDKVPNVTESAKYDIPLVVRHSQFINNVAGNGGALYSNGTIHVYSSHFTQNYSQGPLTKADQSYIPWSAGGCIASNAYCGVVNCLFDNNEARRGLYPITISGDEYIPNADARQGFGGCLSISAQARTRVANCHFMKNKAVAYSAIYNFLANNHYSNPDSIQLAFNTIFWGNEVFEVDNLDQLEHVEDVPQASLDTFRIKYKDSRAGVFHYDGDEWQKYERLFHEYDSLYLKYSSMQDTFNTVVIDKLNELREQGNKVEGLFFCSYRKGYGPSGMKPTAAGYLLTGDEHEHFTDPRKFAVPLRTSATGDMMEYYEKLFTYLHGNNNVLINRINTATDGPNFNQPSSLAGVDGYMQQADWLLARMNITTDQGWGHLKQNVSRTTYYTNAHTGDTHYATSQAAFDAYPGSVENDVVMHHGTPVASFDGIAEQDTSAFFNFLAQRARKQSLSLPRIPIGNDLYMRYTRDGEEGEMHGNMFRISPNPRMDVADVYIDLGIYEYQYVTLDIKGNEVDTMWVATKAKGEKQDGLSWETPTTDLQMAIDVLMSSRNNHDKYICFLGDEETTFSPNNVINDRRAFIITSNSLAPLLPDSAQADYDYGVQSLNFIGGYSFDVKDALRDPQNHPTRIEMPYAGNTSQLNQLFIVEDMTRQRIQANWMGESTARDNYVVPVTFDGITFVNPYSVKSAQLKDYDKGGSMNDRGGAAIYYRWQRQYETTDNVTFTPDFATALEPQKVNIDGTPVAMPKLTISNCIFMDNGNQDVDSLRRSSAVRIEHGGGSSLIVNSLFHSNAGSAIYADRRDNIEGENNLAQVPNDVTIVNSTFALNGGHLTLESDNSELHNSIIWLDDLANDTLVQLEMHNDIWNITSNKSKPGIADRVTHNAVYGCFRGITDTYANDSLVADNSDIFEGPYFVHPNVAAATAEERRARNFNISPGVRTMNMADTAVYRSRVFFRQYPGIPQQLYWRRANGFKSEGINSIKQDYDVGHKPRFSGMGMERGAFECQAVLQRTVYVNPTVPAVSAGDGSSWTSPFGQGQIQNAIDVAAVYCYLNHNLDAESRKAYVFVKGTYDANDQANLIARDGVFMYGSIPAGFSDTASVHPIDSIYTNEICQRYVNYVRAAATGVASPNATPTRIHAISANPDEPFEVGFLMDGFVITNPNQSLATSPLLLNDPKATIRNCIIAENKVANDAPVADIQQGLLYNTLLYNDSAAAIVNQGANGYLLNNTVVNNYRSGVAPISNLNASHAANNIQSPTSNHKCFAPYFEQSTTPYTLPAYLLRAGALNYQLHEHSANINANPAAVPAAFSAFETAGVVNFALDRDILGNPRRIGGRVDNGAFETWSVAPNTVDTLTTDSYKLITTAEVNNAIRENQDITLAFTQNYGGNDYPHTGSVVYLMDSAVMTMAYDDPDEFDNITLHPGFVLMKPGSSFYGNGHHVQFNYLAAEKRFINQRYAMTAFPFNYSAANITTSAYDSAADTLTFNLSPFTFNSYQYSGAARSVKDYVFRAENSPAWLRVDTLNRTATEGYLMDFTTPQDTVLRFNAFAPAGGQYVYTEEADDKSVYLTQYDHRVAGTGADLNFTRQEDMGWNMKGLPWLVSNYRTDTILEEGNYLRQMFIPHVFYQMDGNGEYTNAGQIRTQRSWDPGATMSMGHAFLTQTATQKGQEQVVFHLPYYGYNKPAARPILLMQAVTAANNISPRMANEKMGKCANEKMRKSDVLTIYPDSTANKFIQYAYGRDGIKWLLNDNANGQINEQMVNDQMVNALACYLLDSKRQSRISLLAAAPVEVDIPLGVIIPQNDPYGEADRTNEMSKEMVNDQMVNEKMSKYSFSLPEKSAFAAYKSVWLIDYLHHSQTNLLEQDYQTTIEPGENNARFAIRFGMFPKMQTITKRSYTVYAYGGTLYIKGLAQGDKITVYTPSGQIVYSDTATDAELTIPLSYLSGYIVKVNDTTHKVVNI